MQHDDTSFIVNEEFSNICINFLVTIMSAMGRCYEVGHVCDRSLLRRRSRLSWAVAKMFVTVSMIMSVTPVGVGGSKFLPLYSSTLLLDRVSQNLGFFSSRNNIFLSVLTTESIYLTLVTVHII